MLQEDSMNIAVIGSGGREHALVWKLSQSNQAEEIYCLPGNGGIANSVAIDVTDFEGIEKFCKEKKVELIVVGPEVPLAEGISDYFEDMDIKVFGPHKKAAVLESSKAFAKEFMTKYKVATAEFTRVSSLVDAKEVIQKFSGNCVLKYDGLAAGKGVYVCSSVDEATQGAEEIYSLYGADSVIVIEEKLIGDEISIIGITDGDTFKLLSPSQDHKQLLEGDQGPNTGGMGAYTPVPFANEKLLRTIEREIVNPTLIGIKSEFGTFKGVVYFGIMVTTAGPKLLEYNVRFGDPETEVILPALKSDLLEIILACFDGSLSETQLDFYNAFFIDVVLASGGYPKEYKKGLPISGLDSVDDVMVFHAGTKKSDVGKVLTSGGRVINVVAKGSSFEEAFDKVYSECKKIAFDNVYYRKDIGKRNQVIK